MRDLRGLLLCVLATGVAVVPCLADPVNEPGTSLSTLALDDTFGTDGEAVEMKGPTRRITRIVSVEVDSQDRIVAGVETLRRKRPYGLPLPGVARFLPDGRLDRSFGEGGIRALRLRNKSGYGYEAVLDGRGGVLVVGEFTRGKTKGFGAARLTADGALDQSWGRRGAVPRSVGAQGKAWRLPRRVPADDGFVVLASSAVGRQLLLRIDGEGNYAADFGTGSVRGRVDLLVPVVTDLEVDAQGRILLATVLDVTRRNADGTPDLTFGTGGVLVGPEGGAIGAEPDGLALDGQGRIGVRGRESPTHPLMLFRFLADGAPDVTFSGDGHAPFLSGAPGDGSMPLTYAVGGGAAERWVAAGNELIVGDSESDAPLEYGSVVQVIDPASPGAVAAYARRVGGYDINLRLGLIEDVAVARDGSVAYVGGYDLREFSNGASISTPRLLCVDLTPRDAVALPDLQVALEEGPFVGGTAAAATFSGTVRVTNAGPGAADGVSLRSVLSADGVADPADEGLGGPRTLGPLAPGASVVVAFPGPPTNFTYARPTGLRIIVVVETGIETDVTNDAAVSAPVE